MIRPIAIYLPQFHPIPENDEWWGKGFTEWRNVVSAKPFIKYHYQPHIPADLGFYDLRLNDVFYEQINLAKDSGIHGFMFYEYWFGGKRLLETPIDNYLKDEKITFPYLLCWANENWTRRWDGRDTEVLIQQVYNTEDFEKHFDAVYARHITSKKYIKVDGKPVISIYKPNMIQNLESLIDVWRSKARALGFSDLYFIYCNQSGVVSNSILNEFDAAYEFHPNWKICNERKHRLFLDFIDRIPFTRIRSLLSLIKKFRKSDSNKYYDYKSYSEDTRHNPSKITKIYPGIMTSWDNSPRRKNGNAVVFLNSTPEIYKFWLSRIINDFKPFSQDENFIFINAWNEWAEGAHLEPCLKWGKRYIEVTSEVLKSKP